ncbi:MAG: FAD-binding protein, partial [Gammaproteobacteria bacterium]
LHRRADSIAPWVHMLNLKPRTIMTHPKSLNRRDLVKATALAVGAAGVGGLMPRQATAESATVKAQDSATSDAPIDILIVGAGNAGLPAAIQAADLGARVMVLDKNNYVGGMLAISGGHVSAANSKLQIAKGIEDSPASHYRDAMRMGRYRNNSELLKIAVDNAAAMVDWLAEIGVEFTPESPFFEDDHEHYSAPRTYMGPEYALSLLVPFKAELDKRIERGDIRVRLNTQVSGLIKADDGAVIGVVAEDWQGQTHRLMANAVILATGGYAASAALKEKFNPNIAKAKVICLPHATGDGIVMAEQAGASLVNMDLFIAHPGAVDGASGRLLFPPDLYAEGIWVNTRGERFVNEHADPDKREQAFLRQADFGFFYVIDDAMVRRDVIGVGKWDQARLDSEVSRGVVNKASTIGQLASKIGIDSKRLTNTVVQYNGLVDRGVDEVFKRDNLGGSLSAGPYYAIPITGSGLISHGGVAVNHSLQVMGSHGKPLKGLYAAGETLGSAQMMGNAVLSGMSVGPAITLGRLVARNAWQYAQLRASHSVHCAQQSIA